MVFGRYPGQPFRLQRKPPSSSCNFLLKHRGHWGIFRYRVMATFYRMNTAIVGVRIIVI